MIVAVVVGWVVVLPFVVIVGLVAAPVVTRRHESVRGVDDALAQAREFVGVADDMTAEADARGAGRRPPVGAGY